MCIRDRVEGMVIDKGVTMADLKGTLNTVVEQLYGKGTKTRFQMCIRDRGMPMSATVSTPVHRPPLPT